ncbi:MAG TPA: biopolymer transporter ExbD [Phycisphaerae bacterium]|nr:biopolymer transporter ExbD [Phycisphaerae bacterium]
MARSLRTVAGDETIHYMSPRKMRVKPKPKIQPPLTPMIDIVFQLLLFFLLATEFRQDEGVIVATLPEKGEGRDEAVKTKDIIVSLRPVGMRGVAYFISDENVSSVSDPNSRPEHRGAAAELLKRLEERRDQYKLDVKDSLVIIKPAVDVRWQYIVEAFNQAVRAKFEKIAFAPG